MSVDNAKVAILVFAMPGCPACHEFLPKLYRQVEGYRKLGHPFVIYTQGMIVQYGQIPVVVIDSTSADPGVIALADRHQISALPTTILLPRYGTPYRREGSFSDEDIYALLNATLAENG